MNNEVGLKIGIKIYKKKRKNETLETNANSSGNNKFTC